MLQTTQTNKIRSLPQELVISYALPTVINIKKEKIPSPL